MKNFVQPGGTLTLPAPYDVVSGAGFQVGTLFAIAFCDAVAGAQVDGVTGGVFTLPKNSAQAWAVGARVYWDDVNKRCDSDGAKGRLIGVATVAASNPSSVGDVRLNGCVVGSTPSTTVAPTVATQAAIVGQATVNVPMVITAATFNGSPTPTGTRTIKMAGVTVATGTLSITYTPLQADVGKVPTVDDVGTNTAGSATSTATGAAVAAAAAVVDDPVQISAVGISGNYTKVGLLEPNRKELVVKNTLPWTIEVVQNNALNYQQNLPTSGHIQVLPGKEWDTDETATVWARLYGATATAASFDGTKITATVANHKFVAGMKVAASQAVPAGFNTLAWPNAVDITIVDANTVSYLPQVAPPVGGATTMPVLNAIGSIIVEKKVNK